MATRAQRSYSAFLRETKATTGASHKEAIAAYRALKDKGVSPSGALVRRDPGAIKGALKTGRSRLTKAANRARAEAQAKAEKRARAAEKRAATIAAKRAAQKTLAVPAKPTGKRGAARAQEAAEREAAGGTVLKVADGDEWDELGCWLWDDAIWEHYHSGAEYEYTDA